MNRIIAAFLTLVLLLVLYRTNGATNPPRDRATNREFIQLAESLIASIRAYRNDRREQCIAALSEDLSFNLNKDITHTIPKSAVVDSLVVGNDNLSRWGYLKSVDLGYVRDVEAVITMKVSEPKRLASELAGQLMDRDYHIVSAASNQYRFKDGLGGVVVDDRFQEESQTAIECRYSYHIQVVGEYVILAMKSVESDNWIPSTLAAEEDNNVAKN